MSKTYLFAFCHETTNELMRADREVESDAVVGPLVVEAADVDEARRFLASLFWRIARERNDVRAGDCVCAAFLSTSWRPVRIARPERVPTPRPRLHPDDVHDAPARRRPSAAEVSAFLEQAADAVAGMEPEVMEPEVAFLEKAAGTIGAFVTRFEQGGRTLPADRFGLTELARFDVDGQTWVLAQVGDVVVPGQPGVWRPLPGRVVDCWLASEFDAPTDAGHITTWRTTPASAAVYSAAPTDLGGAMSTDDTSPDFSAVRSPAALDGQRPFTPTHLVNGEAVMLVEGVAYTRIEWDTASAADLEVDADGRWLWQGRPFSGAVRRIGGAS